MAENSIPAANRGQRLINRVRRAMPASRGQWLTSQRCLDDLVTQLADLRQFVGTSDVRGHLFSQIDFFMKGMAGGWCTALKAQTLASIVLSLRPAVVVEIGVWTGRSLIPMALACRENGFGKVIGIDPYKAIASVDGQPTDAADWWNRQQIHDDALNLFRSKVAEFGLEGYVDLRVEPSDAVGAPADIGLLHVDGNHGPQALRDVLRFAPSVHVGGFVVLDDVHWAGGAVSEAGEYLQSNGFVNVRTVSTHRDDWAVFQRRSA